MKTFLKKTALATALALAIGIPTANAVTVSIGAKQDSASFVSLASGTGTIGFTGNFGDFFILASGTGSPPLTSPDLFATNSISVEQAANTGAHTLEVYVTSQGNTTTSPTLGFSSGFTSNFLTSGWSITEKTFYDSSNALWGTTTLLNSATFTSPGTASGSTAVTMGSSPYSVTTVYTLTTTGGAGSSNATISMAIPEPETYAMLLAGLGLMGFVARRRQRNAA